MERETAFFTETTTILAAPPISTGATETQCPLCNGSGWQNVAERLVWHREGRQMVATVLESHLFPADVPPMHQTDWILTQETPAQWQLASGPCICQQPALARARMERILGQAGIPDDCYRYDWEHFENVPHCKVALSFAQALAVSDSVVDESGVERTGLFFHGPPGTFKTTLASLVFRRRVEVKGQAAVWMKYVDLAGRIRSTFDDNYEGPSLVDIRYHLQIAPFLLLDDLGSVTLAKPYAESIVEVIFLVFDHRLSKRLPTLVTTNVSENKLIQQFGAPTVSRLAGLCHAVAMRGPDARRKS